MTAYEVSGALDVLGDPTRRALLERIARRPMAVGELASTVPISRPAVSQHLRVLQDAGLVRATAVGTRRLYSVDPAGAAAVRGYWERFWATALEHFADSARGMVTGPEPENEEQSDGRDG